jgi:aspartyl-tRNA(Asn)/glutamyl-tRNA(Gln) amidotransferase subunit A
MSDPTQLDIADAGAALRNGDIGAVELLDAYLARVDRYDDALNSFITRLDDRARKAAVAADARIAAGAPLSPLDGIPVALKDNIDVAGVNTSNGMARDAVARNNAHLVDCLEAAGAVVVGKLNMHEGALGGTTNNFHHGAAINPWKAGYSPAGSSGGSGAAVSARLAAAALGTDTLGSVRLPAAFCGVYGLMATTGVISTRGVVPLSYELDHAGPLTRSVRDLALMLAAMASFDPASPDAVAVPSGWQPGSGAPGSLQGRRIAVPNYIHDVEADPEILDGFRVALDCLRQLGASVEDVPIDGYEPTRMRLFGFLISEADASYALRAEMAETPEAFSGPFRQMLDYGRDAPAWRYVEAQRETMEAGRKLRHLFDDYDLVVTPTSPQLPFPQQTDMPPRSQADFTAIANYGRCPALSLPCAIAPQGLPVGLHMIAAPFAEAALLSAAAAVEAELALDLTPPDCP